MNFHPEDFQALSEAIEKEGGIALKEACEPKEFKLKVPDFRGHKVTKRYYTTGCGFSAKFELPYNPGLHIRLREDDDNFVEPVVVVDHPGEKGPEKLVKVCAVDDAIGLWPRYTEIVSDRSFQV